MSGPGAWGRDPTCKGETPRGPGPLSCWRLGAYRSPFRLHLGAILVHLEAMLDHLWAILAHLEATLTCLGANLGKLSVNLDKLSIKSGAKMLSKQIFAQISHYFLPCRP